MLPFIWGFIAGIFFNDFLRSAKDGMFPFLLSIIMSLCWPILLVWWFINHWCDKTTRWYVTLAKTVFIEK